MISDGASPFTSKEQLVAQHNENLDDDDDGGDQERLEAVKGFLFDTYRVQNTEGIMLEEYIDDLNFLFNNKQGQGNMED